MEEVLISSSLGFSHQVSIFISRKIILTLFLISPIMPFVAFFTCMVQDKRYG